MPRSTERGDGKLMVVLTILGIVVAAAAMWLAHIDAQSTPKPPQDPKPQPKQDPEPPKPPPLQVEIRFEPGGFTPSQSLPGAPNQNGTWDCYCGDEMEVRPSTVSGSTGADLAFSWDATRICKGLGMEKTAGTLSISKGGAEVTSRQLPKAWGTVYIKINLPGLYDVSVNYHTTCLNNTKSRDCSTSGQTQLNVTE